MTAKQALSELKKLGTAQNRKIYARHGVGGPVFGVSYANLDKLAKAIKRDHDLALRLWRSGNHDARVLATKIADPAQADDELLASWATGLDSYVITDAFAKFAAATPLAAGRRAKWIRSREEWVGRAGWLMVAHAAMREEDLPDTRLAKLIELIEQRIHKAKNRVRDAMNAALIAIGSRGGELSEKALAAAQRIGKVEVDHGETGCKTPDAVAYIEKTLARKRWNRARASGR